MVETRAEQLAAEIRGGCEFAAEQAEELVGSERAYRAAPTFENLRRLEKQRRRLSHALLGLNSPIRLYHELLNPEMRLTRLQRLVRWLADLSARGATFRGQP